MKVKPDAEDVVFIGGVNMFRSTDGFATAFNTAWIGGWSTSGHFSYTNHHADQHAIAFLPSNTLALFSGNDGGVYKTSDDLASTVVWNPLSSGYTTCQFYAVALDHATPGNNVILGGAQDNKTLFTSSANSAVPWIFVGEGDGAFCAIADGRTSYYTSAQYGVVYRMILDNNGNQSDWARVDPVGGSGYLFINPFVLEPNNTNMMYLAGGASLWRNSDLTAIPLYSNSKTSVNWTKLTNTTIGSGTITALGVSISPAYRLYYGTSEGSVFRIDSANLGNPFPTNITSLTFPSGTYLNCLAVDPSDADRVMAVFANYNVVSLFYTTDGGSNWSDVSGNLEQNPDGSGDGPSCRWAAIIPGGGYFVGTSTGLYSTAALNGSSTVWAQEGSGNIGNVVVDMMDTRLSDGVIIAATHGNGMYSATLGVITEQYSVRNGWNIVSVPFVVSDYRTSVLYPTAVSPAYAYEGGYVPKDTLTNGVGYWLKFNGAQTISMAGSLDTLDTIHAATNWNLIGSLSSPVTVSSIAALPPVMMTSPFYGYQGTYVTADTIKPGEGFWVKVDTAGTLILSMSPGIVPSSARMGIAAAGEFPPPPPDAPSSDPQSQTTERFALEQNYPNPFNNTTQIALETPIPATVTITITDIIGRDVEVHREETSRAGRRVFTWSGDRVASGVYLCRVRGETGEGVQFFGSLRLCLVK